MPITLRSGSTDTERMIPDGLRRIVFGLLVWMLGTIVLLSTIGLLTVERFFVASVVGLLAVKELTPPEIVSLRWRTWLNGILAVGILGVGYLTVKRILALM